MAGSGRPPPPLTIIVPGRETPAEVLESGPPDLLPALPLRLRALLLAVVAVLSTGVLVTLDPPEQERRPPVAADDVPSALGVSAEVGLVALEPFRAVLDVAVTIAPDDGSPDDSTAQPAPQLKLMDVGGFGLAVRLTLRSPPLLLGYLGRFAGETERVLHLPAEAVVADCQPETGAPPAVLLTVQRTDGLLHTVRARSDPTAHQALASLFRRTCRMSGR